MTQGAQADQYFPGETLGLPRSGRGSLATWNARLAALVIDWAACMILAQLLFGDAVTHGFDWRRFAPMGLYFLQKSVLTALTSGSFGQLLCRIAVVRLDHQPIGWLRSLLRAAMKVVLLPAVVIGAERRALDDLALGTVVVNRR
ncbi:MULTISPECIES: RDD family protein [unclassified Luteococcus]|uniref:RDD family protein n=1 Tax=unclassified Luteococcus TaxID=2639923 RepID=UPI00313EBA16